jgi:hypothetical protein
VTTEPGTCTTHSPDGERARPLDRPQPPARRDLHRAALLGHDDAERIGALGEAERGRVARAEAGELLAVARQREVYREARDAVVHEHDGAVVAGRARVEEREQQRLGDAAVELDAAFDVPVDRLAAGHDDQRAGARGGEPLDRAHEHVARPAARLLAAAPRHPRAHLLEDPAQVVLEHDHEDEHEDREERLEDGGGELEPELARGEVDRAEGAEAEQRRTRARAADEAQPHPRERRHHRDVREVEQADVTQQLDHDAARSSSTGGMRSSRSRCTRRRDASSTVAR